MITKLKPLIPQSIAAILRKVLHLYKLHVTRDVLYTEVNRWFKDRGDETLRLDYPLSDDSIVFDLGGYKGNFAQAINERYGCTVYLFEPVFEFYDACIRRFQGNPRVLCFNFGLSSYSGEFSISHENDGSSIVKRHENRGGEKVK